MGQYLAEAGLELADFYSGNKSWSDLREDAGLPCERRGPHEEVLRRAIGRLLHIDDRVRIDVYQRFLKHGRPAEVQSLSERDRRLLRMLVGSLVGAVVDRDTSLEEGSRLVWDHPQVRSELLELLEVLAAQIEHVPVSLPRGMPVPLVIHARYSRVEILAGFDISWGRRRT